MGSRLNNRQSSLFSQNMQVESMEAGVYDVDEDIMDLHSSVLRLKHVSKAIQEETTITGKILETLESSMDIAKVTLKQTMKRLGRVSRKTRSNHVLYVVVFGGIRESGRQDCSHVWSYGDIRINSTCSVHTNTHHAFALCSHTIGLGLL
jgi:hypothetical protein